MQIFDNKFTDIVSPYRKFKNMKNFKRYFVNNLFK